MGAGVRFLDPGIEAKEHGPDISIVPDLDMHPSSLQPGGKADQMEGSEFWAQEDTVRSGKK